MGHLTAWRIAIDLFRRVPGRRSTLALASIAVAAGITTLSRAVPPRPGAGC